MKSKKAFVAVFAASALSLGTPSAFANGSIDLLLKGDAVLQILRSNGTSTVVVFEVGGRFKTSEGAVGSWRVNGETICTTRDAKSNFDGRGGNVSCGRIPDGLSIGDTWVVPSDTKGDTKYKIVGATK